MNQNLAATWHLSQIGHQMAQRAPDGGNTVNVEGNERGMIINKVSVASETKIQNHLSCDNNRGRRITIL